MNSIGKINFENKFSKFNALWSPKIIAQLNDYHFKLAKLKENSPGIVMKIQMKHLL